MAPGPGDSEDDVGASPEEIRARMARTRTELTQKLDALRDRLSGAPGASNVGVKKAMPPKKSGPKAAGTNRTAKPAAKKPTAAKPAAKASAKAKPASETTAGAKRTKPSPTAKKSAGKKPAARKRSNAAVAEKATEVLGEVLTGAAVGAVTAAASQVGDQPTAVTGTEAASAEARTKPSGRKRAAAKPSKVLGEMATGAAVGAIAGAAKAALPKVKKAATKRATKKK